MERCFLAFVLPLLLLATAPTSPTATILPDGTYRYATTIGGRNVGSSTIVVRREGAAIVIGESASLAGITLISQRKLEESTFATLSYTVDAGGKHAVVTALGNDVTVTQGTNHAKIAASPGAPFVVSDNMVAGWAQLPATLHASGEKTLTLACLCGGFIAVPISRVESRAGFVSLRDSDSLEVRLTFDPQSYVLQRMDVPSQQSEVVLQSQDASVSALPQPVAATPVPLPPPHYVARDVSIRAGDGVMLAGTLTLPKSAATPLPGIVFVHGSGCIDRDETVGPNKVFAQLANRLSNDGYAVLRYDKRSCGKSGGTSAPRDRLIADARDVIAYLRAQPGIDPNRIYVLGHSEGGELAPSIAIADGRLRGIVLLAPPALPLEQVLREQLLRNATAADRAAQEPRVQAYLDEIAAGKKQDAYNAWLRSSFGIDPAKLIAQVPSPILIVQGTKDIQVLATDTPRLVDAARAANRKLTVVMLPDDDHLFIKLGASESSTGGEYFTPSYLDPALLTAIENWLGSSDVKT